MKKKSQSSGKKPNSLSAMTDAPSEAEYSWDCTIRKLQKVAMGYGFARVETPLLEDYSLYERVDVEHGNIINFSDPDNAKIAIRPEVLPGFFRVYSETKFNESQKQSKWYYISPVFSYNESQRKFASSWEYGFELFGEFSPLNQSHLISLVWKFLQSLNLANLTLEVNSTGRTEHRKEYEDNLRNFLQNKRYELCSDCISAMETAPLKIFRCANLECKTLATESPTIVDFLDQDCRKEFTDVLEGLDELGIMYSMNPLLVGRSGTSRVTFVIKYRDNQSEYFIGEGANHDDMFETIIKKNVQCFGFVGYMEVLRKIVHAINVEAANESKSEVFLVPLGDLAAKKSLRLFSELWDAKIAVHDNFGNIGVKNQLKMAESSKATIALIIGQKEAMDEMVILRDVKSGMQEIFQYERIIEEVKKRLGKI